MRVGIGFDSHRLVEGRKLIIGGVEIPFERGLAGHSDGDVLTHAIIDAMFGALGLGDIGRHYPDTDPAYEGINSLRLLTLSVDKVRAQGYDVDWVDCTVVIEEPKLAPHIEDIQDSLVEAGIPRGSVNVKAKRNEGMGFIGRGEGVAAFAVCTLKRTDDSAE